jgi:hypothetical protein
MWLQPEVPLPLLLLRLDESALVEDYEWFRVQVNNNPTGMIRIPYFEEARGSKCKRVHPPEAQVRT